uniref:Uncharacterized protein n=1 Tax=viral metagenome TaxID=1070528 RepID=A0A6C0KWG3_9ZZZZ
MLKTLFKPNLNYFQIILKNQIRHNSNNLNKFINTKGYKINQEDKRCIEPLILFTQVSTVFCATGGVIIYGSHALIVNVEKPFIQHFIETLVGVTEGFFYGSFVGFFWPVTASVLVIKFCKFIY